MQSETEYDLFVNVSEEDIRKARNTIQAKSWQPWDPVDAFDITRIEKNAAILLAKYEKLKNNPGIPARQWKRALITAFVIMTIGLVCNIIYEAQEPIFIALIFAFGVLFIPWLYYRKLTIDIVKIQITEKMGWFYDPEDDYNKWQLLRNKFAELFSKGGKKPAVEDQIWGKVKMDDDNPFYAGEYHFTTESKSSTTSSVNNKSTDRSEQSHFRHFFCFKINHELKSRLYIEPYGLSRKQLKGDLKDISFKEAFKFDFKGNVSEEGASIARSLSTDVQQKLLELRRDAGNFWILFAHDGVIFMIQGSLFQKVHTSLFKGIEIDPRDMEFLVRRLSTLFEISEEIVKKMEMKAEA